MNTALTGFFDHSRCKLWVHNLEAPLDVLPSTAKSVSANSSPIAWSPPPPKSISPLIDCSVRPSGPKYKFDRQVARESDSCGIFPKQPELI